MGLRHALLLLLFAKGFAVAKGQCGDLGFTGLLAEEITICAGDSTLLVAEGIFPTTTSLQWQLLVGSVWQPFGATNDSVFVDPTASTSFRCFADCGAESDTSEAVDINVVNVVLSITSLAADTSCGAVNDTLIASGGESYTWLPVSSLILVSGDTVISTASTSTTYTVTGVIGSCSASDSITLHVIPAPFSTHGSDTLFCSGDPDASISFTFEGEGPWDVTINGPEGPFSETGNTSGSFTINNPAEGTYQVDTLTTAICPNNTLNNGGPFVVTVNSPPSQATIDQAPETLCQNSTGILAAFAPDTGVGAWVQVSGPTVQLIPQSDSSVSFLPTAVGSYTFEWIVSNAPCDPSTASVTTTVTPGAQPANAGPDSTFCSNVAEQLQANDPAPGIGTWNILSGPSMDASQFEDVNDPSTVFLPASPGSYTLLWTIDLPPCPPAQDTVILTATAPGAPPSIIGLEDDAACDGEYQTLTIVDPEPGIVYSWTSDHWNVSPLEGTAVTALWEHTGPSDTLGTSFTLTTNQQCPAPLTFNVLLSSAQASCPKGIVYFEPHGLAILDDAANYFQWGTLDDEYLFVPDNARTEQTTFLPGLTNCDSSGYVVRTSINGTQCWSTTFSCATPEMLDRACSVDEGAALSTEVRVFPNPSAGRPVTLEAIGTDEGVLNIDVSDLHGRIVSRSTLRMNGTSTATLDIDRLDRGIYVLRTWNTDVDQTIKLVID